jgi:O-antigen/teichoic acid export membrane protein
MNQNQEYNKFGEQIGYVITANIATLLLGFVQVPILTKGLGAGLYGTWSLINITVSLIVPFAMLSFSVSIVRFLSAEKDINKIKEDFFSACSIVFISGVVFSLLLFFLSDYLAASIFKDAGSSSYIKLGSVLILLNSLYPVLLAFFRMRRKIGLYSILDLSQNVLQFSLVVAVILLGYKLGGVITAFVISGILAIMISLFIILRQTGFKLPKFSHMKSYLKWGIPLTPNAAILWIVAVSDRYIVSYFLGVTAAGVYSAAYSIGQYASFVLMPLGIVLYPTISKAYDEGNLDETSNYLKYSFKYLMMIAIPAAFGLSILAKPLLQILTTPEFVVGSSVVPFVAFGAVFYCFYQICAYIINLVGKTQITVVLLGTSAILNVVFNLIFIPRMGIIGAAIATLIAYGVLGMLTLVVTRRYLKFDLGIPFILKSTLSSSIMTLCIWLINPESLAMLIISIFIGVIIYFVLLVLLRALSRAELVFFINFIKNQVKGVIRVK